MYWTNAQNYVQHSEEGTLVQDRGVILEVVHHLEEGLVRFREASVRLDVVQVVLEEAGDDPVQFMDLGVSTEKGSKGFSPMYTGLGKQEKEISHNLNIIGIVLCIIVLALLNQRKFRHLIESVRLEMR